MANADDRAAGEEAFIARYLAPLSEGFPGAFGLGDDCAELVPLPGHSLILKTDPIVAGVHFFGDDAPDDIAWKAVAVNASDIVAKGAKPFAYLMALTMPAEPEPEWMAQFCTGLGEAQAAFGCVLVGGDTDRGPGPLSIAVTMVGEMPAGRMVRRGGAEPGDYVYVSGTIGGSALGLSLRREPQLAERWELTAAACRAAKVQFLRPQPKLGLRAALNAAARAAMDISDGILKDLDRMCRQTATGASIELAQLPLADGLRAGLDNDRELALPLLTAGDDYEVLAIVSPEQTALFELLARRGGVTVSRIGSVTTRAGVELLDEAGNPIGIDSAGYDHFRRT